jgi:hypothetical protein
VTKADGSRQPFDRDKVANTCLRLGADRHTAYAVAAAVERQLYDGVSTDKILKLIFEAMRRHRPEVQHLLDLRKGLSAMAPKPEFELFVQTVLAHNGFAVTPNRILTGKCVDHEVDALATKAGVTYFVEAKHHFLYHSLTGLDESRIAHAVLEDVTDGYTLGKHDLQIDRAMIVTNTRFSEQARRYGRCKHILQIGWNTPKSLALQALIEQHQLIPLSCLRDLRDETRAQLVNARIVLLKQLLADKPPSLARKTGLPQKTLRDLMEKAKANVQEGPAKKPPTRKART